MMEEKNEKRKVGRPRKEKPCGKCEECNCAASVEAKPCEQCAENAARYERLKTIALNNLDTINEVIITELVSTLNRIEQINQSVLTNTKVSAQVREGINNVSGYLKLITNLKNQIEELK